MMADYYTEVARLTGAIVAAKITGTPAGAGWCRNNQELVDGSLSIALEIMHQVEEFKEMCADDPEPAVISNPSASAS